jgi:microcystin-dependent protein
MGTPYISEIKITSFPFAPKNWALCNGQVLPINQNQALFSLLGTTFGGNGTTTFALPDLRGQVPCHFGGGLTFGQRAGEAAHTLTVNEIPSHTHIVSVDNSTGATDNASTPASTTVFGQSIGVPSSGSDFNVNMYGSGSPAGALAPASLTNTGGSQAHNNMQPYLVLNFIIALQGVFPSRN